MPHVDYCNVVLANLDDVHTYRLQRIQNASVRFIFNLKHYDHLTSFFNRLQWLKVSQRQEWHSLALLFKILRTRQPSYLFQRFKLKAIITTVTLGLARIYYSLFLTIIHPFIRSPIRFLYPVSGTNCQPLLGTLLH